MINEPPDGRIDERDVFNHPGALGELAELFVRRQIAAGIDANGGVVLVRPKTLLVDCRGDAARRLLVDGAVQAFNAEFGDNSTAAVVREPTSRMKGQDGKVPPLDVVAIDVRGAKPERIDGERRWSVNTIRSLRRTLLEHDSSLVSEFCTVVLGSQNVKGNPVGSSASFAGEIAFVSDTATVDQRTVMLTTAEPSGPPVLRGRLDLPEATHRRPRVLVLDTGLATQTTRAGDRTVTHDDLLHCCRLDWPRLVLGPPSDPDAPPVVDDEDETDDDANGIIDFEAGHGTFIAGIVRQLCPDAEIYNAGVLSSFGDGDVFGVLDTLARVLPEIGPVDVVVLSFGLFFADDDAGLFGPWLMTYLDSAVGVAAAGNQNTCRPYFPAALPDVVSVGGLAAGGKAWFSNFGPWVDASAPAIDVVSTFFDGLTERLPGGGSKRFAGWARWSGTSFSAPKVGALIAQEMYLFGGTPKQAWKRLISHKLYRHPDLGIVFNA